MYKQIFLKNMKSVFLQYLSTQNLLKFEDKVHPVPSEKKLYYLWH